MSSMAIVETLTPPWGCVLVSQALASADADSRQLSWLSKPTAVTKTMCASADCRSGRSVAASKAAASPA